MQVPVNVYGRSADATALVYHLLATFPMATLAVDGDVSVVTTELPPGGTTVATINVGTAPFDGPDGDRQRQGMAAFVVDQVEGPERERVLAAVPDLRVGVAILVDEAGLAEPDVEEAVLELAQLLAGWADGFVLSMVHGEVLGPDGEVWGTLPHARVEEQAADDGADAAGPRPTASPALHAALAAIDDPATDGPGADDPGTDEPGAADPATEGRGPGPASEADIPVSLIEAAAQAGDLGAGVVLVDLPDDLDATPAPEPPPLSRVVARMLALVAVSARSLTEEDGRHLEEARAGILAWCEELGIAGEIEPHERALLDAEPAAIGHQELVNGSWGAEAASVLAWALHLIELPAHDVLVEPRAIYEAIGFPSSDDTIDVLRGARLRDHEELEARQRQLVAIHRRLRRFGTDPEELPDGSSVDGDLAVGGRALAEADADRVRLATSIALERHRAITWLVTGGRYSETDVAT